MAHFVSRSTLFAALIASVVFALATPAEAKKKKAEPAAASSSDEFGGGGEAQSEEKKAPSASQAGDVERPKPIADEAAEEAGPKADERGNVTFGGKKGKGKITVNAPAKEKVKVYLEGRYFGVAPRTINNIPPGDYIVEVVFPNGKSLSKPVSVLGDEESTVSVGAADAVPVAAADKPMSTEAAEKRWNLAKTVGIVAVGAVVVGLGMGVWEYTVQKDHDKLVGMPPASNASAMDIASHENQIHSLESKGDKLALGANILYVVGGVALVTAVFIGYPAYKALHAEKTVVSPEGNTVSFMVLPTPSLNGGTAGMVLRF